MRSGSFQPGGVFRKVWLQRWLLHRFVVREIQNRYAGSVGGLLWAMVHPLVLLGIYSLLFQVVFKVKFPEFSEYPFIVYLALAMWPWLAFSEGLSRGTQAVVANAALVKKVAFPHELLVYAAVLASFAIQFGGYVVVLMVLWLMGVNLSLAAAPTVFLMWGLLLVMSAGLALAFSAVQVFLRDFEQFLGHALSVLFYLTPILYPMSMVPAWMQNWMQANPLVHLIEPMRQALLLGHAPAWGPSAGMVLGVAVVVAGGRWVFLRLSPHFEDVV